jgi:sugar phosphate permease
MPEMITVLKITKAQAGAAASSYDLSYAIYSPFLGYSVDRVSARRLLPLFSFILAGGTFRMGKPTSLYQAGLFFAIVGVGSSAMWSPVVTRVQSWYGTGFPLPPVNKAAQSHRLQRSRQRSFHSRSLRFPGKKEVPDFD